MIEFPKERETLEYIITNTDQNIFDTIENKDYIIIEMTHNSITPKDLKKRKKLKKY